MRLALGPARLRTHLIRSPFSRRAAYKLCTDTAGIKTCASSVAAIMRQSATSSDSEDCSSTSIRKPKKRWEPWQGNEEALFVAMGGGDHHWGWQWDGQAGVMRHSSTHSGSAIDDLLAIAHTSHGAAQVR